MAHQSPQEFHGRRCLGFAGGLQVYEFHGRKEPCQLETLNHFKNRSESVGKRDFPKKDGPKPWETAKISGLEGMPKISSLAHHGPEKPRRNIALAMAMAWHTCG